MDPEAALVTAYRCLSKSGERRECAEALQSYFEWRLKGGFQPHNGDERALRCLTRLGSVADVLERALNP